MSLIEFFQFLSSNIWIYGGTFLLVLSILVFVHEWGHYIVARMCGVRVENFSIGFGREIFGYDDKNGTRWKFSLIPLGGYVKLYGDVDPASAQHTDIVEGEEGAPPRPMTDAEKEQAFFNKPVWKRAAVVFAGPAINYIFAIILMAGLFMVNGQPVTPPVAAAVVGGSNAEKYEFQPGDKILSIGGKTIYSFQDIRREMMIALDEEREFVIDRNGEEMTILAKPEKIEIEDRFGFKHSRGVLGLISPRHALQIKTLKTIDGIVFEEDDIDGKRQALIERMGSAFNVQIMRGDELETLTIRPMAEYNKILIGEENTPQEASENEDNEEDSVRMDEILYLTNSDQNVFVQHSFTSALSQAVKQTYVITVGTLEALGQMITGTRSATELGGIIRIGAVAGDMAQQGLIALIMFTALLSINLGLINLFPIPMLDGGHLVFYFFEAILGKPIPEQIQEYAFRVGLVMLVCLMVFANLNDILQLVL